MKFNIKLFNLVIGVFILLITIFFSVCDSNPNWFPIVNPSTNEIENNSLYSFFGGAFTLSYYTFQTNYIVAIVFILSFFKIKTKSFDSFFLSSVSYIVLTFVIYWTAIVPFASSYKWNIPYWVMNNFILHFINPSLSFIVLFINRKRISVNNKYLKWFSLYPMIFVFYASLVYYLGGSVLVDDQSGEKYFQGLPIYKFLDVQSPIFINLEDNHLLALFVYFFIAIFSPFLMMLIMIAFIKIYRIKCNKKYIFFKNKNNIILTI